MKNTLLDVQNHFTHRGFGIKWVHMDMMHITLEFLGNLSLKEIENIYLLLKKISEYQKDFVISLSSKMGTFPSINNPHIIWAGIEKGSSEL